MSNTNPFSKPILFQPLYKEKLWGGQHLKTILSKMIPESSKIGESWELSSYGSDLSIAYSENFKDQTLQKIIEKSPKDLLGHLYKKHAFPLLFKFIDANDKLSVQVHPDSVLAKQIGLGCDSKTECWYIVDAKPEAKIIVGFKNGVTKNDVKLGIKKNSLGSLLNHIPITKNDLLFIPGRTVHAILGDTIIYEIQESSDTTFRLYDWGRLDKFGKPRQLHIKESLQTINITNKINYKIPSVLFKELNGIQHFFRIASKYFALEEYCFKKPGNITLLPKKSFSVITVFEGPILLSSTCGWKETVLKGQTVLIPAACYQNNIIAEAEENCNFVLTTIPDIDNEVIKPLKGANISNNLIDLLIC